MATEQQIKEHPIWDVFNRLAAIKGDQVLIDAAGEPQTFGLVQQIFQFVSLVERRVSQTPWSLLALQTMNGLHGNLQSIANEVQNYINNINVGHLHSAINILESTFGTLAQIPVVDGSDMARIAGDFNGQIQGVLQSAISERDKLKKEGEELRQQLSELKLQVQSLSEAVVKQNADAANVVSSVQTLYAKKEQEFTQTFNEAADSYKQSHEELIDRANSSIESTEMALKHAINDILKGLMDDRSHAQEIVGIIGNIGVTGNYQKTANDEGKAANLWRWVTISFFVLSISIGIWALRGAYDVGLPLTIARVLFAFLILGATVYTGKESARHRTNADRAKRIELELASLGPFMESLDKSKQAELRAKLTEQYFGKENESHQIEEGVASKELLKLLEEMLKKIGK